MTRYFTLEEATALLPRLRAEIGALREGARELGTQRGRLDALKALPKLNGHRAEADALEQRVGELLDALRVQLHALADLGVEVKDLDEGLVDFPSWREGRVVYLCWRVDEERIAFWHELEAGVRGRQPL